MKVLSTGRWQVQQRARSASRTPIRQIVPWAKVVEKDGGAERVRSAVTSVHFPKHNAFKNRKASYSHKKRWSTKLGRLVNAKIDNAGTGDNRLPVLAGDFNILRCALGTNDWDDNCRPMGFWKRVMDQGYRDTTHVKGYGVRPHNRIDFLFSKANISQNYWDFRFRSAEYSDHGHIVALLEDEDRTPPQPPFKPLWELNRDGDPRLYGFLRDESAWDGGLGVASWEIYRRQEGEEEWHLIGTPDVSTTLEGMTMARSAGTTKKATKKTAKKKATKRTTASSKGFTPEERAAMRERARELKAAANKAEGEKIALAAIAKMPEPDRSMGKRLHEIIKESAPDLASKTWYGMPAYVKDDNVVCFFQSADKFKARYATLGFNDTANLDQGDMWPTSFALKEMTPDVEKKIALLVKKAVS